MTKLSEHQAENSMSSIEKILGAKLPTILSVHIKAELYYIFQLGYAEGQKAVSKPNHEDGSKGRVPIGAELTLLPLSDYPSINPELLNDLGDSQKDPWGQAR